MKSSCSPARTPVIFFVPKWALHRGNQIDHIPVGLKVTAGTENIALLRYFDPSVRGDRDNQLIRSWRPIYGVIFGLDGVWVSWKSRSVGLQVANHGPGYLGHWNNRPESGGSARRVGGAHFETIFHGLAVELLGEDAVEPNSGVKRPVIAHCQASSGDTAVDIRRIFITAQSGKDWERLVLFFGLFLHAEFDAETWAGVFPVGGRPRDEGSMSRGAPPRVSTLKYRSGPPTHSNSRGGKMVCLKSEAR